MGSIKDRNGMDLTEAEDIKKRWQEYTEELYKKIFNQEGRRGSEEAVPGPSVFPSREPGVSGDFWGSQEGCQG